MPDVAEGLSSDPNSEAGFLTALAQQAGTTVPEETLTHLEETDTSVAAGLTEESVGTPNRDEGGRFAPAATPEEDDQGGAPAGEGGEGGEVEVDPRVTEFLSRHEGNADAALAAALREKEEAQSLIGRQSAEVGEVRQQLARLEGRLDERQRVPDQPAQVPMVDDNTISGLENMADQQGGRQMMTWVVNNRPDLIEHAEKVWAMEDPLEAADFRSRRAAHEVILQERARAPQQVAPQEDAFLQGLRQERQFSQVFDSVRGGMSEGDWNAVKDHLLPALETSSPIIRNAVVSQDYNTQVEGVKTLVEIARGRVVASASAQANQEVAAQALERKRNAQVASGSLRPVPERQPESGAELTSEQRAAAFHKALMATETTSVRDGLVEAAR